MLTPTYDALLAQFSSPPQQPSSLGPQQPKSKLIGFEDIDMPARATAADLQGYQEELAAIRSMDSTKIEPKLVAEAHQEAGYATVDTSNIAAQGGNALQQLAALAAGVAVLDAAGAANLVWRLGINTDFWTNVGLIRAGQGIIWQHLHSRGIEVFILKKHAIMPLNSMGTLDGYSNVIRQSIATTTAILTGADLLTLPPFAASMTPDRLRVQANLLPVLAEEGKILTHSNLFSGAYWPDLLAAKLMRKALKLDIATLHEAIAATAAARKAAIESGQLTIVGETKFANPLLTIPGPTA